MAGSGLQPNGVYTNTHTQTHIHTYTHIATHMHVKLPHTHHSATHTHHTDTYTAHCHTHTFLDLGRGERGSWQFLLYVLFVTRKGVVRGASLLENISQYAGAKVDGLKVMLPSQRYSHAMLTGETIAVLGSY